MLFRSETKTKRKHKTLKVITVCVCVICFALCTIPVMSTIKRNRKIRWPIWIRFVCVLLMFYYNRKNKLSAVEREWVEWVDNVDADDVFPWIHMVIWAGKKKIKRSLYILPTSSEIQWPKHNSNFGLKQVKWDKPQQQSTKIIISLNNTEQKLIWIIDFCVKKKRSFDNYNGKYSSSHFFCVGSW